MEEYRLRVRIFMGLTLIILTILGGRLFYLQLIDNETYSGESRNNAVRENRVVPARGLVYDRNGILMVDNEPTYTITLIPRYFNREKIGLLASLLEVPDSTVANRLDKARKWSAFKPTPAFREVSFDVFSRIRENSASLPGVSYEIDQKRRYVTEARASHALGYIREISERELDRQVDDTYRRGDLIGKTGIERTYEDYLRGQMGSEFMFVDIRGIEVDSYRSGAEDRVPLSGYAVELTIDSKVQALAESLFVNKRGGAIALDPNTGEVIAMVSMPDYDPSIFTQQLTPAMWNYLSAGEAKPLFNRATQSAFMPGSTWKPFMALLSLQEGDITPDSHINCPGYHPLGRGRMFRCMHVHGSIDVVEAIKGSCNTFFFESMMRTDVNTFRDYSHMFGFGLEAPTDIAEQDAGLIPDSSYFNRVHKSWTPGYSINLGIGQGDMKVTPLQLARYMGIVATGGTIAAPHLVRKMVNPRTGSEIHPDMPPPQRVPIKEEYFDLVRLGMKRVMEEGTGYTLQVPGIASGGKTGTAQSKGEDDSVFVMFAPYDDPQIAIAVYVEDGRYGSTTAGPIASFMAEQYLTGSITTDTWQRKALMDRVMNFRYSASSEVPIVENESGE